MAVELLKGQSLSKEYSVSLWEGKKQWKSIVKIMMVGTHSNRL